MEHVIPTDDVPKREAELGYYQWVPIILLFMSLLFKIPRIIWKVLTFSTAINLDKVAIVFIVCSFLAACKLNAGGVIEFTILFDIMFKILHNGILNKDIFKLIRL